MRESGEKGLNATSLHSTLGMLVDFTHFYYPEVNQMIGCGIILTAAVAVY